MVSNPNGLSERPQEVDDVLLVLGGQHTEALDNSIGLAPGAPVVFDSLHQIGRAPVPLFKHSQPWSEDELKRLRLPEARRRGGQKLSERPVGQSPSKSYLA